jgi:hypothetical protein
MQVLVGALDPFGVKSEFYVKGSAALARFHAKSGSTKLWGQVFSRLSRLWAIYEE